MAPFPVAEPVTGFGIRRVSGVEHRHNPPFDGVVGDNRAYEYVIALRAVETVDFMTANWARLPYDVLATISTRIINEVRGTSRVAYDISGKPPATVEWE